MGVPNTCKIKYLHRPTRQAFILWYINTENGKYPYHEMLAIVDIREVLKRIVNGQPQEREPDEIFAQLITDYMEVDPTVHKMTLCEYTIRFIDYHLSKHRKGSK